MASNNPTPSSTTFPISVTVNHDVHGNYGKVPETFHKTFGKLVGRYATITASNGRRFSATYVDYGATGGFSSGWNIFRYNCVEERNVIVNLKYHGGSLFSFSEEEQGIGIYLADPYPPPNPSGPSYRHPIDTEKMMTCITLTEYSVSKNHQSFPTAFVTSCVNLNYKHVLIEVQKGRVFICRLYSNGNNPAKTRISSGWKAFCMAHNLRAGDRIRFEVRDRAKNRWVAVLER